MPGKPLQVVEESLGFAGDRHHPIKLDCERKNLHLVLRRIDHPISSGTFADLDWLLTEARSSGEFNPLAIKKTVIYVDNVMQGKHIESYLQKLLPDSFLPHKSKLIRSLHAATCVKCKDEILDEFSKPDNTSMLRIVIATEAFGCGIDIGDIFQVINFGTPRNFNSAYQRAGRSGRALREGLGVIYVGSRLWDSVLNPSSRSRPTGTGSAEGEEGTACKHFKKVLEAHINGQCLSACVQKLYSYNPDALEPPSNLCMRCSGCLGDNPPKPLEAPGASQPADRAPRPPKRLVIPKSSNRGPGRMLKNIGDPVRKELADIIEDAWLSVPASEETQFDSIRTFISAEQSRLLFNHIRDLESVELVRVVLGNDWKFWHSHGKTLGEAILELRGRVILRLQAETQNTTRAGADSMALEDKEDSIPEEESEEEDHEQPHSDEELEDEQSLKHCEHGHQQGTEAGPSNPRRMLIIRIPPRAVRSQPAGDIDDPMTDA